MSGPLLTPVCLCSCEYFIMFDLMHMFLDFLIDMMMMMLSFPQECPSGVVNEETFKNIYSKFFPQGGQTHSLI